MTAEPDRLDSEAGPDPQPPQPPQPSESPGREHEASPQAARERDQANGQSPGEQAADREQAAPKEAPDPEGAPAPEEAPDSEETPDSGEATAQADKKRAKRSRPFWRELAVIVIAALVLTILLKAFVVQVFSIPSGSMENTLVPGDRVLVNKLVYRFRSIDRGDVVVFSGQGSWDPPSPPGPGNPLLRFWDDLTNLVGISAPGTDYIKRVIGLPGDRVACCDAKGRVTVNGVPLNEQSYIHPGEVPSQIKFDIKVPPGRLWVMGDNRADSDDSRYRTDDPGHGSIPESAVVGRAFVVIWPTSRWADLPIPNTFKQAGLEAAAAAASLPGTAGGTAALAAGGLLIWRRRRRT
jgi:signal peptidase I